MDYTMSPVPSRRSFPDLNHLSLAPLSSRFPIDDDGYEAAEPDYHTPRSSYIQAKTAPATPGILSRSSSRTGMNRKKKTVNYAHDGYALSPSSADFSGISKARSASALLSTTPRSRHHNRTRSAIQEDEWLHRAGLVIASEARESKGQSWLATRSSSTSLVNQNDDDYHDARSHQTLMSGEYNFADDEYSPVTPRFSRYNSRAASRAVSARNSRRGSRVGSKIDMAKMTPLGPRTPSALAGVSGDDYFNTSGSAVVEPDFVESEGSDGGVEDEQEVSRLTRDRSFGLGGWVDRLVSWTLFEEDGEMSEEEQDGDEKKDVEEVRRRELEELRRRERLAMAREEKEKEKVVLPDPAEQEGGWQDAAWLLSVASKVLL